MSYQLTQFSDTKPAKEVHGRIVSGIQHLKAAEMHFSDFIREHAGTKGEALLETYNKRINWIFRDILSHPFLPQQVREGVRKELDDNNALATLAINDKIALVPPDKRDIVELFLDEILAGKEVNVINNETIETA